MDFARLSEPTPQRSTSNLSHKAFEELEEEAVEAPQGLGDEAGDL